jgi:hypothetical protein
VNNSKEGKVQRMHDEIKLILGISIKCMQRYTIAKKLYNLLLMSIISAGWRIRSPLYIFIKIFLLMPGR